MTISLVNSVSPGSSSSCASCGNASASLPPASSQGVDSFNRVMNGQGTGRAERGNASQSADQSGTGNDTASTQNVNEILLQLLQRLLEMIQDSSSSNGSQHTNNGNHNGQNGNCGSQKSTQCQAA